MRSGAIARMFQSIHASKRSSGRAVRPITGADPPLPTFPFCLQRTQKTSDAWPESPVVGSRRLASQGVSPTHAQAQASHRSGDGRPTSCRVRRRDDAGVGRAADAAGHPPRRRAGHGDGRRAARYADRPDPDPRRQRADRQRPGRHAPAPAPATPAPAGPAPTPVQPPAPGAGRSQRRPEHSRRRRAPPPLPAAASSRPARPTLRPRSRRPACSPHSRPPARSPRLKLRLMLPRRPRTTRRRRPRTPPTRRSRMPA